MEDMGGPRDRDPRPRSDDDETDPLGLRNYILDWSSQQARPPTYGGDWKTPSPVQPPSGNFGKNFENRPPAARRPYGSSPTPAGKKPPSGGSVPVPYHLEAERSVLAAILVENEAFDRVLEIQLHADDFFKEAHQKIFEAALALYERREPIDLVTLTAVLRDRNAYEVVGGTVALTGLFEEAFAVGNVAHYARIVKDKAVLRKMIHTCGEIIQTAYAGVEDTEAFLDEAESKVFKVSETKLEGTVVELKSVLLQNMSAIEEVALRKADVTGLPTGFAQFDRLTTGLHPGQVMILAARPGMGKTSWFISALQHAAIQSKAVVALFSLEMSKEEIGFRFLSGMSRIDARNLKIGKLTDRDWHSLAEAADRLSKSKIFIDDSGGLTVMEVRSRSRRLLAMEGKLDLIVVDYIQLMRGTKSARNEMSREREISEISRNLKELSKELKVPIIALSQLNRGVESRQDKRPTLADLRESGAIEQDADMVCFIHREDYYDKESENKGIAELIVAKNRSGETDAVRLAWIGKYTLFANLNENAPGTPLPTIRPSRNTVGDVSL